MYGGLDSGPQPRFSTLSTAWFYLLACWLTPSVVAVKIPGEPGCVLLVGLLHFSSSARPEFRWPM